MVRNLLNALADLGLLTSVRLNAFKKSVVRIDTIKPSDKPLKSPRIEGFYSAVSQLKELNVDTVMTIAEEWLTEVDAPLSYGEGLSAYDVLRHKLMIGNIQKFLIIYGSLSGIQDYLYDVKSSQALKQLRGRSFYLYLLQDAVVERALRHFNLSRQAVLYSTGGTFCMLIPYDDGTEERFRQFKREVTEKVFNTHKQNLILLNSVVASLEDIGTNLSEIFSTLHTQKNKEKYSPLRQELQIKYTEFFTPHVNQDTTNTRESIKLGEVLGRMKSILISSTTEPTETLTTIEPGGLGLKYHLLPSTSPRIEHSNAISLIIFNEAAVPNISIACRREYLAGIGAQTQSFADLFEKSDGGIKRLGILRMDVDNLGSALRKCYAHKNAMIHFAKMSRRLDIFFKKRLNEIWHSKYKNSTVIVYSGGDDLFIAGEWLSVWDETQTITQQYKKFFASDGLSLSGGISLVDEKFPIMRAADYSADEESQAKHFSYTSRDGKLHTKDAISIFGCALRWDVELKYVVDIYNTLYRLKTVKQEEWNPIIRRILNYFDVVKIVNRSIVPVDYIWLMTYDMSRLKRRLKRDNYEDIAVIDNLIKDITTGVTIMGRNIDSPYHSLQLWAIAARLVELQTRQN